MNSEFLIPRMPPFANNLDDTPESVLNRISSNKIDITSGHWQKISNPAKVEIFSLIG